MGVPIYKARNIIYRKNVEGIDLTVKCFKTPSLVNRGAYTYLRKSKARRAYENALRLQKMGIGTPEPIAYIEEYEGGLIKKSFYICKMLVGVQDLRYWNEKENCEEVMDLTAKFIYELHKKGIWHKDFSPGNILYDNQFKFYLIDINRMKFGVKCHRQLMQNFKCLHDDPSETARIARAYAGYANWTDIDKMMKMALAARRRYKTQQARKRRLKDLFGHKKE